MTFYLFRLLSPQVQVYYALTRCTYLAQRWENEGSVNRYHCASDGRGFFVEAGVDDGRGQAVVLRSFSASEALADYAQGVRLPGE